MLVGSSNGMLELYKWGNKSGNDNDNAAAAAAADEGGELKLLTRLESEEGTVYTSGCMHPDGFIYIAGTNDGSLIVWDLKTQAVAGTLKVSLFYSIITTYHTCNAFRT